MNFSRCPFADFNPDAFSLVITCADGLENALLTELTSFNLTGKIHKTGRVNTTVSLVQFYHLCLYSRVASRLLLPIGEYPFKQKCETVTQVTTDKMGKKITRTLQTQSIDEDIPETLYRFTSLFDWQDVFSVEQTFAIRLVTDKRLDVNQQFATLRIKDAIADSFNTKLGKRPDVDAKNPDCHIFASANPQSFELFLDLSGTSLHKRGYRVVNTQAPLKENLAAALLYECNWHQGEFDALIDPMCGSGTLITEALLMRTNYPVGLEKSIKNSNNAFGFYAWKWHNQTLWQDLSSKALDDFHQNLNKFTQNPIAVFALDADSKAVQACHKNLAASGLMPILNFVHVQHQSLSQFKPLLANLSAKNPLIITNPPYGERLGVQDFIKPLYQGLGLAVYDGLRAANIKHGTLAVLASDIEHADTLPIQHPTTLKCHNGALTVYFRYGSIQLDRPNHLIEAFEKKTIIQDDYQEFINRLQKNLTHLKKLAKKNQVTNLRIYDADLPNYNAAIDLYGDKVHVQEYAPPKQISPEIAKTRFNQMLAALREVLDVSRDSIFIKTRAKQSGNDQYHKQNSEHTKPKKMNIVQENGAYFYVNFTDYLDTGLFLDHRNMRTIVAQNSRNKRVLNLFAYTCSASVHAAIAGAKSVVSVDLSANYLTWGQQNFALNGLVLDAKDEHEQEKYQFIAEDTFEWIKNNTAQFDVIFIDPPTFSNSKKFKGTFDVQRDHAALINRAMNRLAPDGVLYFSNNFTKFNLSEELYQRYDIENITNKTIGFDFNIKKPIHHSFKICHKNKQMTFNETGSLNGHLAHNTKNPNHDKTNSKANGEKFQKHKELKKQTYDEKFSKKSRDRKDNRQNFIKNLDKKSEIKKPTIKTHYEKIDGKMIQTAAYIEDDKDTTQQSNNPRYQVKKTLDKAFLEQFKNKKI